MTPLTSVSLRRLILGSTAIIALAGLVGIVGVLALTEVSRNELERHTQAFLEDEAIADRITGDVYTQAAAATSYARNPRPGAFDAFRGRGERIYADVLGYLRRDLSPEERIQVERVKSGYERLEVLAQDAFLAAGDVDLEGFEREVFREAEALQGSVDALIALRLDARRRATERQAELAGRLRVAAGATAAIFLFLIGLLTYFLRRRLVEPLEDLSAATRRLGETPAPVRVPVRARDELGEVAQSFNEMVARLATARIEREEARDRLRDLVESLNVVVWEADAETLRFSFVSRHAEELFGVPVAHWVGEDLWSRIIHADDRESVRAALRETAQEGEDREIECRATSGVDDVFWVRILVGLVDAEEGGPRQLRGVISDVTERRRGEEALSRSEALFRALVEHGAEGVEILDRDGAVRYRSPAAERILGFQPGDRPLRSWYEHVHPDDETRVRRELAHVVASPPTSRRSVRYRARHRDGSWRTLEATAQNLVDDPYVRGIVIHMVDVTERDRLAEQLLQAQKMEAVGTLAGGIAHDFNNLLTVITGNVQLLRVDGELPAEIGTEVDEIEAAAGRAVELTRQLLAFSSRQVTRTDTVDLSDIVGDMRGMLARLLGEDLRLETPLCEGAWVRADSTQMEQVVLNLALNARDAMPTGGVLTIETRIETLDEGHAERPESLEPGSYVVLSVADTGNGIPPDVLPHIFEPFFTTKPAGVGTGLGLAMVYGIAQQSDGQAVARNRDGGGARFDVYLPAAAAADHVDEGADAAPAVAGGTGLVLLVEDDRAVRTLVKRSLERHGYAVVEAQGGEQALALLDEHEVDLLLTDVVMPGISGPELAREVVGRLPGVRVLFMTGYARDALDRRGLGSHDVQLVEKPFTPARLASAVQNAIAAEPWVPAGDAE